MLLRFLILFIPFFLSSAFYEIPEISYMIAWVGLFFILWFSLSGSLGPVEYNIYEMPMRPLVLTQLIFIGYMGISSIFFYLDTIGYYYLDKDEYAIVDPVKLNLVAQCQRYYCLGHASFVCGIFAAMDYPARPIYRIPIKNISSFTLYLTYFFSGTVLIIKFIPGLAQVHIILSGLAIVSSVISLAYAIPEGRSGPIIIAGSLFIINEIAALTSGWKEAVIVPIIMLGTYLYPTYKKLVITIIPVIIGFYFYFIPTYNTIVRDLSWSGKMDGTSAALFAVESLRYGNEDVGSNNWGFMTTRLSEINMFTQYVSEVPSRVDFYGFKIVEQALESIIPRVFYKDKPVTEYLVMERVYEAGVISSASTVSAKPPPIVDGYLSGGAFGVLLTCFFLGAFASWASSKAERLFGSYLLGSGLIFTGLYQILWRGNCFEFMANNLFWSTVIMYIIFYIGKQFKFIQEVN